MEEKKKGEQEKEEKTEEKKNEKIAKEEKKNVENTKNESKESENKTAEKSKAEKSDSNEKEEKTTTEKNENKSNFKVVKPNEGNAISKKSNDMPKGTVTIEGKKKKSEGKKKGNGGKVVLVIILLLILICVCHYLKNQIVFKKIMNNGQNYVSSENYQVKSVTTNQDSTITREGYYLDGSYKVVVNDGTTKTTIATMKNKVAIFTEKDGEKTVKLMNKENVTVSSVLGLENRTLETNTWFDNLFSKVSEEENGEKYYVIRGMNSNIMMEKGKKSKYYINKETGLIEKIIETGKEEKEDEKESADETTTYTYSFDNVKSTDLTAPNLLEYEFIN